MERLIFICPTTGKSVDIGIESDIGTLLKIRGETVHAACPACGAQHQWQVNDASLSPSLTAPPAGRDSHSRLYSYFQL